VNRFQLSFRLALVAVVVLLVSLAYASPPDPTSISGLWDDGDHDDVVICIAATAGVVQPSPSDDAGSIQRVIALLRHRDERSASSDAPSVIHARAPPVF